MSAGPSNYQEIKVKQDKNRKFQHQGHKHATNRKLKAPQKKTIKTLAVVCGVFFICYLPILIFFCSFSVLNTEQRKFWYTVASICAFMNCAAIQSFMLGCMTLCVKEF